MGIVRLDFEVMPYSPDDLSIGDVCMDLSCNGIYASGWVYGCDRCGLFMERFGNTPTDFKGFPCRVLCGGMEYLFDPRGLCSICFSKGECKQLVPFFGSGAESMLFCIGSDELKDYEYQPVCEYK